MTDLHRAFGIYENEYDAEVAVDQLTAAGFLPSAIRVLHPDNQASRHFAHRKATTLPAGIGDGTTVADLPLDGSWGLLYPGEGPIQGALPTALADMGIPLDWSADTVRDGRFLLSVECPLPDVLLLAETILRTTGAQEIAESVTRRPDLARTAA